MGQVGQVSQAGRMGQVGQVGQVGTALVAALVCATASPRARAVDDAKPLEVRALASEIDQFLLREVTAHCDDAMAALRATGASDRQQPLGRGARGPIPLHLIYEARDVRVTPGQPVTWQMTLRPGT